MARWLIKSSSGMKRLGARLAKETILEPSSRSRAKIFALSGDLGSGKTTFVQGFIKALGVKQRIVSPTFLIFRPYRLSGKRYEAVYHVDLYRIKRPEELNVLGFKEMLKNPKNIVLIEWAERARKTLPRGTRWIHFKHVKEKVRRVSL